MGYIGTLLIIVGNIWLAKRHPSAFILIILGNMFWLIAGIKTNQHDVSALALACILIHARNYLAWKSQKSNSG